MDYQQNFEWIAEHLTQLNMGIGEANLTFIDGVGCEQKISIKIDSHEDLSIILDKLITEAKNKE